MSSRSRAGNPAGRYDLRNRKLNAVQQSPVGSITPSKAAPRTPEPGSQGDISGMVRPVIKTAERKDRTVEQNVKSKSTRRAAKPAEPDIATDSDGSDYSNSSDRELPQSDRQSHVLPTNSASKSSAKRQPSPPTQPDKYSDDDTKSSLFRPPIRRGEVAVGSAKKQPFQARQPMDFTNADKQEPNYYIEESWRGSAKTQQSQSSSEDDEEEALQRQPKLKEILNETLRYKEERETLKSTNRGEELIVHHRYQPKPKDREEELIVHHRYQPKPKENRTTQRVQSRSHFGFSDDDEEKVTRSQQKKDILSSSASLEERINHLPEKKLVQKANIIRKQPTKSSLQSAGTCIIYLVPVLLLVGSAAILYISSESVLKMADQLLFAGKPQVKKDLKDDFEKLSSVFTDQSQLMWNRSRRILELHLEKWKGNTEPAIILLTGARDAEQTLLCLGTRLADIYSSSVSGNYTVISGSEWATGSNEEVKEYIDDHLSAGFQATTQAAVLHRLELLPAGSLLILYKYCDHESAVFKNVMLLLTVLLDNKTLAKDIPPMDLEEKVRAFLIHKLIVTNAKASHDGMDKDKFSGVWSRISHVVLPVFPEKNIKEQCVKKPN